MFLLYSFIYVYIMGKILVKTDNGWNDFCTSEDILTDSFVKKFSLIEEAESIIIHGFEIIGSRAFINHKKLKEVFISGETSVISSRAFQDCRLLETIEFPESITYIGDNVFRGCISLANITFPKNIKIINPAAFQDSGLTKVDLSDCEEITSINDYAFRNCLSLKEVTLPQKIKTIGVSAFENCYALKKIDLSNTNVFRIERGAFERCFLLKELKFPKCLKWIGKNAFLSSGLNKVDLPDNIQIIEEGTFQGCTELNSIYFPKSLNVIKRFAFSYTKSLINLGNLISLTQLERIENGAFKNSGLKGTVSIPYWTKSVGDEAFYDCIELNEINLLNPDTTIDHKNSSQQKTIVCRHKIRP